jgi:hypothetical protein
MIATQVYVLAMRAKRAENSRQNEFGCGILKPSYRRKLFDLQHAKHLPLDVDDVW